MAHRTNITYPNEIIRDEMTADEIVDLFVADTGKNFATTVERKVRKVIDEYKRSGKRPQRIYGKTDIFGKSGQRYRFVVHQLYSNGNPINSFGAFMFITVHAKHDMMYYTFSVDDCDAECVWDTTKENISVNRYTSHVVHRYAERKGSNLYGENGFINMMLDNPTLDPIIDDSGKLVSVTKYGSFIGFERDGKNCINTFYSDSIVKEHRTMRKALRKSYVREEGEHYLRATSINSTIRLFEERHIDEGRLLETIDSELKYATKSFFDYYGKSEIEIRAEVGNLIKKNAIRGCTTHRDAHIDTRQNKLCVQTCIPRLQKGVSSDSGCVLRQYASHSIR